MNKKIILPSVAGYSSAQVTKYFNELVKYCGILTKYVQWVNIRETNFGLRFWVRTDNYFYIGDYENVFDTVTGTRYKNPKDSWEFTTTFSWIKPVIGRSTFVKIK